MQQSVEVLHKPLIRDAKAADVDSIFELMENYMSKGILLPRSKSEIYDNLMKFSVIEIHGQIIACGALEIFTETLCEVRSLVVSIDSKRQGLGCMLVEGLTEKAKNLGLKRVMALTYVPEFFHSVGFRTVPKSIFPEKVWGVCIKCHKFTDCDETAVLKEIP